MSLEIIKLENGGITPEGDTCNMIYTVIWTATIVANNFKHEWHKITGNSSSDNPDGIKFYGGTCDKVNYLVKFIDGAKVSLFFTDASIQLDIKQTDFEIVSKTMFVNLDTQTYLPFWCEPKQGFIAEPQHKEEDDNSFIHAWTHYMDWCENLHEFIDGEEEAYAAYMYTFLKLDLKGVQDVAAFCNKNAADINVEQDKLLKILAKIHTPNDGTTVPNPPLTYIRKLAYKPQIHGKITVKPETHEIVAAAKRVTQKIIDKQQFPFVATNSTTDVRFDRESSFDNWLKNRKTVLLLTNKAVPNGFINSNKSTDNYRIYTKGNTTVYVADIFQTINTNTTTNNWWKPHKWYFVNYGTNYQQYKGIQIYSANNMKCLATENSAKPIKKGGSDETQIGGDILESDTHTLCLPQTTQNNRVLFNIQINPYSIPENNKTDNANQENIITSSVLNTNNIKLIEFKWSIYNKHDDLFPKNQYINFSTSTTDTDYEIKLIDYYENKYGTIPANELSKICINARLAMAKYITEENNPNEIYLNEIGHKFNMFMLRVIGDKPADITTITLNIENIINNMLSPTHNINNLIDMLEHGEELTENIVVFTQEISNSKSRIANKYWGRISMKRMEKDGDNFKFTPPPPISSRLSQTIENKYLKGGATEAEDYINNLSVDQKNTFKILSQDKKDAILKYLNFSMMSQKERINIINKDAYLTKEQKKEIIRQINLNDFSSLLPEYKLAIITGYKKEIDNLLSMLKQYLTNLDKKKKKNILTKSDLREINYNPNSVPIITIAQHIVDFFNNMKNAKFIGDDKLKKTINNEIVILNKINNIFSVNDATARDADAAYNYFYKTTVDMIPKIIEYIKNEIPSPTFQPEKDLIYLQITLTFCEFGDKAPQKNCFHKAYVRVIEKLASYGSSTTPPWKIDNIKTFYASATALYTLKNKGYRFVKLVDGREHEYFNNAEQSQGFVKQLDKPETSDSVTEYEIDKTPTITTPLEDIIEINPLIAEIYGIDKDFDIAFLANNPDETDLNHMSILRNGIPFNA